MKKLIFILCVLLAPTQFIVAQILHGSPGDSATFNFSPNSSLTQPLANRNNGHVTIDTSGARLWAIGNTVKPFFNTGADTSRAIMTDTVNAYPISANDAFVLKIAYQWLQLPVISFKHKYQTTANLDGGIVEYSTDNGQTWNNVGGDCNATNNGGLGMQTENFYSKSDTIYTGEPAFTGISNGWQVSYLQFPGPIPLKGTVDCGLTGGLIDSAMIRFRFVSDANSESLDGWIIDDIKVKQDVYASVKELRSSISLNIYPNPTLDGNIYFPALNDERSYTTEIINAIGQTIMKMPYNRKLDLSVYPKGLYYYKVSNNEMYYSGQILLE